MVGGKLLLIFNRDVYVQHYLLGRIVRRKLRSYLTMVIIFLLIIILVILCFWQLNPICTNLHSRLVCWIIMKIWKHWYLWRLIRMMGVWVMSLRYLVLLKLKLRKEIVWLLLVLIFRSKKINLNLFGELSLELKLYLRLSKIISIGLCLGKNKRPYLSNW